MPTVQGYGAPKVSTRPVAGVKRDALAGGVYIGDAISSVGQAIATPALNRALTIATAERERADQTAVLTAKNKLALGENVLMHDPKTGALNTSGKDTQGLLDTVPQQFNDLKSEIYANDLHNDRQRQEFEAFASQRYVAIDYQLRDHIHTQMDLFDTKETESFIANNRNGAIAERNYPDLVSARLAETAKTVDLFAARKGLGPQARDEMQGKARTDIHAGVIDAFLANEQEDAASAYYKKVENQIDPEARDELKKKIDDGTLRGQAQAETLKIMGTAKTLEEAAPMIDAITNSKLEDDVRIRVEHQFALKDQLERKTQETNLARMYNLIDQGKGINAVMRDPAYADLTTERSGLRSYAEQKARGVPVKTDTGRWLALFGQATSQDPKQRDAFRDRLLIKEAAYISQEDLQMFAKMQGAMRTGDIKESVAIAATEAEAQQIASDALKKFGIDPAPPDPGNVGYKKAATDRVVQFRAAVRAAVSAKESELARGGEKRKPSTEEMKAIVDGLVIRTRETQNYWFQTDVTEQFAFEPKATVTKITQVPAAEQAAIRASYAKANNGAMATDALVLQAYNAQLASLRGEVTYR